MKRVSTARVIAEFVAVAGFLFLPMLLMIVLYYL